MAFVYYFLICCPGSMPAKSKAVKQDISVNISCKNIYPPYHSGGNKIIPAPSTNLAGGLRLSNTSAPVG